MATAKTKYWRERPPGPEQTELERMFLDNEINYNTNIDEIQKSNPLFMSFSNKIFSAHLRKTRALLGLCAAAPSIPPVKEKEQRKYQIPELSGAPNAPSQSTIRNDDLVAMQSTIEFENPPHSLWMYTDHQKKTDFVCVLLPIFSGQRDIDFDLSEDGTIVTVNYTWPSEFYKSAELFKDSIAKKELSHQDPKIHCFVSNLIDLGITENSNPPGKMSIQLPCKVKREIGSWTKKALQVNETKMIMLEFTAYQKALLVNDADTTLNFA